MRGERQPSVLAVAAHFAVIWIFVTKASKKKKFFFHTCSKTETLWNTLVQHTISIYTQRLSQLSSYNFLARTVTASLSVFFSTSVWTSGKFSTEGFFVSGFFFFLSKNGWQKLASLVSLPSRNRARSQTSPMAYRHSEFGVIEKFWLWQYPL